MTPSHRPRRRFPEKSARAGVVLAMPERGEGGWDASAPPPRAAGYRFANEDHGAFYLAAAI